MSILKRIARQFSAKEIVVKEKIIESTAGKYSQDILQIHYEFDTAADRLVAEAQAIINNLPKVNTTKIDTLARLGFSQVPEVIKSTDTIKKKQLSKEQIELVNYYRREYPFNKFITEEQVKEICHKYNLVYGEVNRFKGFVPDKNLKEIENFKLKKKEKTTLLCRVVGNNNNGLCFGIENAEVRTHGEYSHIHPLGADNYNYAFQLNNGWDAPWYASDHKNLFGLKHLDDILFEIENKNLRICAPVKDMDISDLELVEGYKLQKEFIPDTIVLQPVEGGALILTAWGDEASDPIVVNNTFN